MKKLLALILIVCSLLALTSCGAETYELAIGVAVTAPSADAVQVTETVAALVLDQDGKIVAARLDTLQAAPTVVDGVAEDASFRTKAEKKNDYGMSNANKVEWFEQARAFESYLVGKTLADVQGIDVNDRTLVAGCTIGLNEFIPAIVAAFGDSYKVTFEAKEIPTLGVGVYNTLKGDEENPTAQLTVDYAAVAMVEGKVVAATLDCADATMTFEALEEGYGCSEWEFTGTKRALGDDYNMVKYGGDKVTCGEWYVQAQAYANSAVGKTAAEVASLATKGVAGCTITADSMQAALNKAAQNVR